MKDVNNFFAEFPSSINAAFLLSVTAPPLPWDNMENYFLR